MRSPNVIRISRKRSRPSHRESDREDALKQYNDAIELLEHLTAADSTNARYRIALAEALTNSAQLYVRMAATRCRAFDPSAELDESQIALPAQPGVVAGTRQSRQLPPARARRSGKSARELARCNDSLAKLDQVH